MFAFVDIAALVVKMDAEAKIRRQELGKTDNAATSIEED